MFLRNHLAQSLFKKQLAVTNTAQKSLMIMNKRAGRFNKAQQMLMKQAA